MKLEQLQVTPVPRQEKASAGSMIITVRQTDKDYTSRMMNEIHRLFKNKDYRDVTPEGIYSTPEYCSLFLNGKSILLQENAKKLLLVITGKGYAHEDIVQRNIVFLDMTLRENPKTRWVWINGTNCMEQDFMVKEEGKQRGVPVISLKGLEIIPKPIKSFMDDEDEKNKWINAICDRYTVEAVAAIIREKMQEG